MSKQSVVMTLILAAAACPLAMAQIVGGSGQVPPGAQGGVIRSGGGMPGGAPARVPEKEAIAGLKAELEQHAAADRFAGAAMVARKGKPIFKAAHGYADNENKIRNKIDTKFNIGSMGKMFTGTAVLQLVQAGRIKLDDSLGTYLSDYPNKDVAKVTIHQLLTHTGGTGNIFGPEELSVFNANRAKLKEPKDYIALFGERGLRFEPGSKWEYSNYGYVLLGRVIEAVSGQSYFDYVREHVFKPAGMKSTDSYAVDEKVANKATGYTRLAPGERLPSGLVRTMPDAPKGPLRANEDSLPYKGSPAGGNYSTVGDLVRFADAILSHKLLDAEHTDLLITGKASGQMPGSKYAYGFEESATPDGVRTVGHNGAAPGISGQLKIFPDSGYVVVVLANRDLPAAIMPMMYITSRLPIKVGATK